MKILLVVFIFVDVLYFIYLCYVYYLLINSWKKDSIKIGE